MKVAYENSLECKVLNKIEGMEENAIVRQDLVDLGSPRQISRVLNKLVKLSKLVRLGYGVYGKLGEFWRGDKRGGDADVADAGAV